MTLKRLSVVLLACLTLTACGGVDPNSPLGQRKAIFKQMLKTGEDLGGMLRGRIPFDGQKFADGAVKLDALSHEPWKHFPQVREEDHTSAKDDVWQKQAQFQQMADQRLLVGGHDLSALSDGLSAPGTVWRSASAVVRCGELAFNCSMAL